MKKSIFKNSTFWSLLFVAAITGVTIWYVLKDDTAEKLLQLQQVNIFWVVASMSLVVFWWFSEAYVLRRIGKIQGVRYSYRNAVYATIVGQFYSLATPAATGGDFLQTYYMNKQGVKLGQAISMVTVNLILYVASLLTMALLATIIAFPYLNEFVPGLSAFLLFGFGSTLAVYATLVTAALSEKLHHVILGFIGKILTKISAEKSEKRLNSLANGISEFRQGIQLIGSHKLYHFRLFLINCARMVVFNFLPIFVALAFGMHITPINFMYAVCGSIMIALITSFIPIPGASGGSEVLFTLVFSFLFTEEALGPGLLVWRSGQFYFTIIIGGVITVAYSLYMRKKMSPKIIAAKEELANEQEDVDI